MVVYLSGPFRREFYRLARTYWIVWFLFMSPIIYYSIYWLSFFFTKIHWVGWWKFERCYEYELPNYYYFDKLLLIFEKKIRFWKPIRGHFVNLWTRVRDRQVAERLRLRKKYLFFRIYFKFFI
jgi:hypothetical protein